MERPTACVEIAIGTAPTLGTRECSMPYALWKAFVLRELFQRRGNLVINRKTCFDPGHGVPAPAPPHRSGKGKDDEFPERDAFRLGPRKAGCHQAVNQLRHDDGIGMLEEGKQRDVALPIAYFGPRLEVRGEACTNLLNGLVGVHEARS